MYDKDWKAGESNTIAKSSAKKISFQTCNKKQTIQPSDLERDRLSPKKPQESPPPLYKAREPHDKTPHTLTVHLLSFFLGVLKDQNGIRFWKSRACFICPS